MTFAPRRAVAAKGEEVIQKPVVNAELMDLIRETLGEEGLAAAG